MTFDDFPSLLARAQAHADDFLRDLPTRFVGARASRDEMLAALDGPMPMAGEAPMAVLDLLAAQAPRGASACAAPRYFAPADLPKTPPPVGALTRWSRALAKEARTADHPFNAGLMLEALVAQARNTLHSRH